MNYIKRKINIGITILGVILFSMIFISNEYYVEDNDAGLYELDFDNSSLYEVECFSKLKKDSWEVKNSTCSLVTSLINVPGDSLVDPLLDIPVNVTLKKGGNLNDDCYAVIKYSVNDNNWVQLDSILGSEIGAGLAQYIYIAEEIKPGSNFKVKITLQNPYSFCRVGFTFDGVEAVTVLEPAPGETDGRRFQNSELV